MGSCVIWWVSPLWHTSVCVIVSGLQTNRCDVVSYLELSQVRIRGRSPQDVAANQSLLTQQGQHAPQYLRSHVMLLLLILLLQLHHKLLYTGRHTYPTTYIPGSRHTVPGAHHFVDCLKCILTPLHDKAAGQMSLEVVLGGRWCEWVCACVCVYSICVCVASCLPASSGMT